MAKLEKSVTINAPVEKVFSYVGDPQNQLEWLPGITEVRDVSGQGVGGHFSWTYKMAGLSFKGESEVTEEVPNQRRVLKTRGGIQSLWTWIFEPEGGGTRVNLEIEYTIPVPVIGKLGERLVLRQNERETELALANIKGRMED